MDCSYSIAEARDQFTKLVYEAESGTPVEITRRGRRVAVLLSTDVYKRLSETAPSLWKGICDFRADYRLAGLDDEDVFGVVREPAPGREIRL